MGPLGFVSAIASMQGNFAQAFVFLGLDFLDSKSKKEIREENYKIELHNQANCVSEKEYPRFLSWALSEKFCADYAENSMNGDVDFVKQWNLIHGNTLKLYEANGLEHNIDQMMRLWVKTGKQ